MAYTPPLPYHKESFEQLTALFPDTTILLPSDKKASVDKDTVENQQVSKPEPEGVDLPTIHDIQLSDTNQAKLVINRTNGGAWLIRRW